jgi:multiple antibiotic resistance protein
VSNMIPEFVAAFVPMFVIIEPLASIPLFLALTKKATASQRARAALEASIVAAVVLTLFVLIGLPLLEVMGIGFQSFKIAGGLVLLIVGIYSVLGIQFTEKTKELDIAVVLIAVPMMTGPGAMSMAIILSKEYGQVISLSASLCAIAVTGILLRFSGAIRNVIGNRGLEIQSRVFGLFVAALAIQFISEGIFAMVVENAA